MITTINIRISSGHVNMPLPPSAVIEGSSATVAVDGVPSRKSGVAITGCIVSVTNPAGQTTSVSATAMGGQYVATIPASHFGAAGNVREGVMIECVGKDEQNADRSWRLGIGDLVVIPSDANPTSLGTLQGVNYRTSVPANPVAGDLAKHGSTWKIFTGSAWESFGGSGGTPDWEDVQNKPTSFPPSAHSSTHAADGSDPITPEGIGAVAVNGDGFAKVAGSSGAALQIGDSESSSPKDVAIDAYGIITRRSGGEQVASLQLPDGDGTLAKTSDIPALAAPSTSATNEQAAQAKATGDALAVLAAQLEGKLDATNPVLWGPLNFDTVVDLLYNGSSGNLATQVSGESPRDLAHTDELEYDAANDDTRPEGLAQPRSVSTYKVVAGTPLTITLPSVSASDKSVSNLDLIIDAIGVTTLPAITIQPATGGKAYAVKGTMPEIKADCITIIDATSIPGMNAWAILGASELEEVTNA